MGLRRGRRAALADRQVPRARTAWPRPSASCAASEGDLLLFVADQPRVAAEALGALRLELGRRFGLIPEGGHDVLWVVDFPMFEPADERLGRGAPPVHRARRATSPIPGAMRSRGYDLSLDGWELGGGSIRINTPEVQQQVFKVLGMSEEEGRRRFGFLLDALQVRRPAARRHRAGHRPRRRADRRPRLDPRRHRLPQDGLRRRPADRRAGPRRRRASCASSGSVRSSSRR